MTGKTFCKHCLTPILASSLMILSACGGGAGPADVTDDADGTVATDTIGNDTLPADANGRDVGDVTGTDVVGDAVNVDAVQDVPVDAALDVTGDAVTGDVNVDTVCVPDCTGGPCSDDGCGGDCCDDPNQCDKNYDGTATVCLPREGTTCAQVGTCSSTCADAACASACYEAGSADARDAIWAIIDCVTAACPVITEDCAVAAYGEGGACYTEYSNCMNGCTPDCSGGPCTDDGCGGDCCDAPNVCQTPESGVGLECVPATEKTCQEIWACAAECGDQNCAQQCINSGSAEGQSQLTALINCLNDACPGGATEECIATAVLPDAACYTEYVACT